MSADLNSFGRVAVDSGRLNSSVKNREKRSNQIGDKLQLRC